MPDKTSEPGPVPFWIKLTLLVSLALNLLVAGMMLGAVWRHDGEGRRGGGPGLGRYATPYVAALPREDRREMFKGLRREGGHVMPDRATRNAQYAAVIQALRAVPFDAAALEGALAKQGEMTVRMKAAAEQAWVAQVSRMSDTARAEYAEAVEAALRQGAHHKPGQRD